MENNYKEAVAKWLLLVKNRIIPLNYVSISPLDHKRADSALDKIQRQTDGEQRNNGQAGKPAQAAGHGNADPPGKTAVKQEGNEGLAAGAGGEIGGIGVSTEGHDTGVDANQVSGQQ